ncbi:C-type lectin mannose-binding isoform-like [Mobula hypostoma]|uniref:C-type lectin mannose-binding isoform-like n=1 Tax=Mobula hypostoma TaxID=723540 RepID=UPI002FC2B9B2
MLLLLFLLLSKLANSDGEGTNNSLVLKRTQRDLQNYRLSRGPCDENWFYFPPLNSCYRFFSDKKAWMAAEDFCNQLPHSGHLASVMSSIHNNFTSDVVSAVDESKPRAWIGMNDRLEEGTFTWIDGTSYTYGGWAADEPNSYHGNEDCVNIHHIPGSPEWNDSACNMEEGFICAYKLHCI